MSDLHEEAPYLSVVAASRNDDHGGSLLGRMQTFVNAFIAQCRRHGLSAELILVEWNPPADRPPLAEALRWPEDLGPCQVRIIQVPQALHQRYQHAASLPLYQMIAKNVGIRRARGKFVLASNIDILFNDELMRFLAEKKLDPARMYRLDRFDVMADVPVDASPDQQLAYCETHLLRVNMREGTVPVTPAGDYIDEQAPAGITYGRGWYPNEQHSAKRFRWAHDNAELTLAGAAETSSLRMELEPGPSAGSEGVVLTISDKIGGVIGAVTLQRRMMMQIDLPASAQDRALIFSVQGGGMAVQGDARILNFRVFGLERLPGSGGAAMPSVQVGAVPAGRVLRNKLRTAAAIWKALRQTKEEMRVGLPVAATLLRRMGARLDGNGLSIVLNRWTGPRASRSRRPADYLHCNACGDFTLMARQHWIDLRGYAEFDLYSFNIDALFCFAAHHAGVTEQILETPLRIYHIEHGSGSGWTPEGQQALFDRLDAKGIPYVERPEVAAWAAQMARLESPMIFNRQDWGLGEAELPETVVPQTFSIAP